jgi:hypothetical protein
MWCVCFILLCRQILSIQNYYAIKFLTGWRQLVNPIHNWTAHKWLLHACKCATLLASKTHLAAAPNKQSFVSCWWPLEGKLLRPYQSSSVSFFKINRLILVSPLEECTFRGETRSYFYTPSLMQNEQYLMWWWCPLYTRPGCLWSYLTEATVHE